MAPPEVLEPRVATPTNPTPTPHTPGRAGSGLWLRGSIPESETPGGLLVTMTTESSRSRPRDREMVDITCQDAFYENLTLGLVKLLSESLTSMSRQDSILPLFSNYVFFAPQVRLQGSKTSAWTRGRPARDCSCHLGSSGTAARYRTTCASSTSPPTASCSPGTTSMQVSGEHRAAYASRRPPHGQGLGQGPSSAAPFTMWQ